MRIFVRGLALLIFLSQIVSADVIRLSVDATHAPERIFHSRIVFPAQPGPMTLVYPKWFPGTHSPSGQLDDMMGLRVRAGSADIPWVRDAEDMFAFHFTVPQGANQVEVALDFVVPTDRMGNHHPSAASEYAGMISWTSLLLYPKGVPVRDLTYAASLQLPAGWQYGTALKTARQSDTGIEFTPVSLYTLVDSPVVAGLYFRTIDLAPGSDVPYLMHIAADSKADLEMKPAVVDGFKKLMPELMSLFGARHFTQYHFLVTLSDPLEGGAVEHHESSDNRPPERMLLDDDPYIYWADTLPHEMIHSWVGKYRRPAGLDVPDYQQTIHSELLWVYEGLTNYLGFVLAGRTGLLTAEQFQEGMAWMAAVQDQRPGRTWRPLYDTAAALQVTTDSSGEWASWRRGSDYYNEGTLIWLEVDTILRQKSSGKLSLDDFCRSFFGGTSGPPEVKPFTLDEMIQALNTLQPYDWKSYFNSRIRDVSERAPLGGIENAGWKLVYGPTRTSYFKAAEKSEKYIDLRYSLGLVLSEEGAMKDVLPFTPAAKSGAAPGMKLLGVNGRHWSQTRVEEAVAASKESKAPLELLLENGDFYKILKLDYHEGSKYPSLQRVEGKEDLLMRIASPRTPQH